MVEEAVISCIKEELGSKYDIQPDIKVKGVVFDAVGVSKAGFFDYIFEIKYFFSLNTWNAAAWDEQVEQLKEMVYHRVKGYHTIKVRVISEHEVGISGGETI